MITPSVLSLVKRAVKIPEDETAVPSPPVDADVPAATTTLTEASIINLDTQKSNILEANAGQLTQSVAETSKYTSINYFN